MLKSVSVHAAGTLIPFEVRPRRPANRFEECTQQLRGIE